MSACHECMFWQGERETGYSGKCGVLSSQTSNVVTRFDEGAACNVFKLYMPTKLGPAFTFELEFANGGYGTLHWNMTDAQFIVNDIFKATQFPIFHGWIDLIACIQNVLKRYYVSHSAAHIVIDDSDEHGNYTRIWEMSTVYGTIVIKTWGTV